MARALWEHACPVTGRTKQRDERWTCFRCRERARLASVRYSMIEQMGKYSRCYGFGSVGPHRPLADKLLKEITVVKCEPCAGTGDRIVGDEDVRDCTPDPDDPGEYLRPRFRGSLGPSSSGTTGGPGSRRRSLLRSRAWITAPGRAGR